jgi:DNA-binding GntR family transcriptional regulator
MRKLSAPMAQADLRNRIEEDIASGHLAPGARLDEATLAQRFGVSRTPVREALQHLAATGLVELRPRRGAVVAEVSPHRLIEMFEVMAELEAMSGRLAARRMDSATKAEFAEAHTACRLAAERDDPDAYYVANERFHALVYAASGNSFLSEQAFALHRRLRPFRRLQLRVAHRLKASLAEHERSLHAILAGDGESAARELRAHVVVQGERFGDLMASLQRRRDAA